MTICFGTSFSSLFLCLVFYTTFFGVDGSYYPVVGYQITLVLVSTSSSPTPHPPITFIVNFSITGFKKVLIRLWS